MVVGETKRTANIMDGIENTGDVRLHDHRLRLKQRFDIVRKLGQGTYGKVQLGINKKTGQEVAIKTIKKCKIETEADLIRIRREVQIMSSVRHPNIVHIYEVFENSEKMILVMEYCSGGELYDYLSQKKVLEEDEARRLFRQIATAVYYCHIHKICHRDLKLENVLLDDTGSAKIADFGLSNVFKETSLLSTFCGSPLYASPEIVKGTPYIGPEVDCWSLGVLLYTLVYGAMPFDGSNFKRLVRQISNGDYYEPKNPSTASPLIRDMLTVDPLKRADIAYICDHPWVNTGCETSCLEMSEALAAETPVRLDLLLSLAPAAATAASVLVPPAADLGPEESCTDLTSSTSMAVEPSNSAEKRILELVAEGGEDAIKPSPTRTLVAADGKRRLDANSCASMAPLSSALPEEEAKFDSPPPEPTPEEPIQFTQPSLKSSATMTISPAPTPAPAAQLEQNSEVIENTLKDEESKDKTKVVIKKKVSPSKSDDKTEKLEEPKDGPKLSSSATDKVTSPSLAQPTAVTAPAKPKKLSIPGGHVGSFKEQFERRASLTAPEVKRNITKPVVSKIAKPKAQSEDRELSSKSPDNGSVRLQQIGIHPAPAQAGGEQPPGRAGPEPGRAGPEPGRAGVQKADSSPAHCGAADPAAVLQDARRSLQNSMAKLAEERAGEDSRRRAARDIISSAIRTGKPPVPYGRSSSAGVAGLLSSAGTPPAAPPSVPRVFRTEALHRVEDHRNRGVSVERIIPITMSGEESPSAALASPATPTSPGTPVASPPASLSSPVSPASNRVAQPPLRRLPSAESEVSPVPGEPIKKSAREFIIPIAVEGQGYVTPRQRSAEPERRPRPARPRRISSLVSGGESEEEDDTHMHRLRSTRAARAESVSSGEEDEEDEGFHLLTAENLFSTLLHRVRALTQRLNGDEGPAFERPHSLFYNLQSPFFNSPHLPRRHLLRDPRRARELATPFDAVFGARPAPPRGSSKKTGKHQTRASSNSETDAPDGLDLTDLDWSAIELSEREMQALSGLTPALSRRLRRQLLLQLPARLRRTLSLGATPPSAPPDAQLADAQPPDAQPAEAQPPDAQSPEKLEPLELEKSNSNDETVDSSATQFCTLPRVRRRKTLSREPESPPSISEIGQGSPYKLDLLTRDSDSSKSESLRYTQDRPLLSKYLAPEKKYSLDETTYSSDGGSILSEPSYIAAYGSPATLNAPGSTFRRHSLRLSGDQSKKRISRFLRSDFFDAPSDESSYAKHKKEKELETQKILKEIREKKNKSLETVTKNSFEMNDSQLNSKDECSTRKCLSPVTNSILKDRSRSNTPFFPILDNIKETNLDSSVVIKQTKEPKECNETKHNSDSKLSRPKSYPVKNIEKYNDTNNVITDSCRNDDNEIEDKKNCRESKLIRPKSYPTSSPSPEKVYMNRNNKKDDVKSSKESTNISEGKTDVEVSFSITLPKKSKSTVSKSDSQTKLESGDTRLENKIGNDSLTLKRYKVINVKDKNEKAEIAEVKVDNSANHELNNVEYGTMKNDGKLAENQVNEKKGVIKKKIIKKVSSKSKTDLNNSDATESKNTGDKKKIIKKVKEKDKNVDDTTTKIIVPKKKSVLQSIGHKLEKFASSKSNSPEKVSHKSIPLNDKNNDSKQNRNQREHSVPANIESISESNLIKRAVTITDVAALENGNQNKTTVSKVLGLFKKFDPKEKSTKSLIEKNVKENSKENTEGLVKNDNVEQTIDSNDKPKRPNSLLLNGLGRKNRFIRSSSEDDNVTKVENSERQVLKKENNSKNTLKLDFSRLPRVKSKIVPTNAVIEPQVITYSDNEKYVDKNDVLDKNKSFLDNDLKDYCDTYKRSRSRSRSTFSNSDLKPETAIDVKNKHLVNDSTHHIATRNHESISPEKEDIVDRIRRKSFYSRFNEKKQRRKSSLVGPGAVEYDPLARIHSHATETKYDASPTSPGNYDLSPGLSIGSDLSPSTERYRSLLSDLPINTRSNYRYDGINDKVDLYRSLDRKYSGQRSYLDYDQPSSYNSNRYSRTKSLFESTDSTEDQPYGLPRDSFKYSRTNSLFTPGSYATYRPKRTRNSAIILKESEKEPSPENILDKIRQKKISISVTRKPDPEKESVPRSNITSKSEGDSSERAAKID